MSPLLRSPPPLPPRHARVPRPPRQSRAERLQKSKRRGPFDGSRPRERTCDLAGARQQQHGRKSPSDATDALDDPVEAHDAQRLREQRGAADDDGRAEYSYGRQRSTPSATAGGRPVSSMINSTCIHQRGWYVTFNGTSADGPAVPYVIEKRVCSPSCRLVMTKSPATAAPYATPPI